jgi:hypothetical protein
MTSPSFVQMLEGRTAASTLATLNTNDQNSDRVYYLSYTHSVAPDPSTSWLDTLANVTGAESPAALVDGVGKIVPKSLLPVLPPRNPYVMVVYCVLRYLCGLETFPLLSSAANGGHGGGGNDDGSSERKQLPYFDFPKHGRKVLYSDLIHIVEHLPMLHICSAAAIPPDPIVNAVRLYISSLRYFLDPYARSGRMTCPS